VWNHNKQTRSVWHRKRPGEFETKKDLRVWNRKTKDAGCLEPKKDQESLEPKKTRRVWDRKRKDHMSLVPEEKRPGESETGREKTRKV
jgi:hypothetical protein